MKKLHSCCCLSLVVVFLVSIFFSAANADEAFKPLLSQGQTIYVPAYSHIYSGNREHPFLMTVTVGIRNVDLNHSITITAVDYYNTKGKLIRKYLKSPLALKPLETTRYVVPQKDKEGGSGANFIVIWNAEKTVNSPIVETIMIGQQGISFTSRARIISTEN